MSEPPNQQMRAFWNELAAPRWIRLQEQLDAQLDALGEIAIEGAGIGPGQAVIDVGCGCGTTTLAIARRVAPGGRVLGIDISEPMLEQARRAAEARELTGTELVLADAQTQPFEPGAFDAVISRFGVMFFDDPTAAFANLRGALRQGGRLSFVCWQKLQANAWATIPLAVVERHLTVERPSDPTLPGPFAFADPERVRRILESAGLEQIRIESIERQLPIGHELDAAGAAAFLCELGPAAAVLRDHPEHRAHVVAELEAELGPHENAQGNVVLAGAAWHVTARH